MTKVVLKAAADLRGHDSLDLTFTVRNIPPAQKWIDCLNSVKGKTPWKWGYTASQKDLPRIEKRIKESALKTELRDTYLKDHIVNGELTVSQEVINTIHRFVEDHHEDAWQHLGLHNDIHYWEGIMKGDANPTWKKIMWNPPGLYVPYEDSYYDYYTTEACDNFLMQDFAHVGRDPFNSFTFRDDLSMETSCVIQHSVTSGFKWIIKDDSTHYTSKETEFRNWVSDNMDFFSKSGVKDCQDPKLSFGRIILADGDEDYTKLDPRYEFVLRVDVV